MTSDVQRDLGRMEAQIETLVAQVAQLNAKVDAIDTTLSEAKGGWRMLLLVGGAAGAIGGLIGKLLPFFDFRGG
jgi:hypothetical protein